MSFADALSFPMKDPNWVTKLIIGAVAVMIPILGWLVLAGYCLRLIKNVLANQETLPEWDDIVGDFSRGIMLVIGNIVYYFPSILMSCCGSILGNSDNSGVSALICLLNLAQFGYSIIILPFWLSAMARFANTESMGDFFNFGQVMNDVTSHASDVLMLYLNSIVLYIISAIIVVIGFILLCLPGLLALAFVYMAYSHLVGQWGRTIGVGSPAMSYS